MQIASRDEFPGTDWSLNRKRSPLVEQAMEALLEGNVVIVTDQDVQEHGHSNRRAFGRLLWNYCKQEGYALSVRNRGEATYLVATPKED